MGLGKKGKLIKTNYLRTSQTGRQVSGPKIPKKKYEKQKSFKKKPGYTIQPASNTFRSIQSKSSKNSSKNKNQQDQDHGQYSIT